MHRRTLGVVLAGGDSRRFGSDKALALLADRAMIDHVIDLFDGQTDQILICGRGHRDLASVADRPVAGLGPLGGLNAALHYADERGFEMIVTLPCDTPKVSSALIAELVAQRDSAVLSSCPVIGAWSSTLASKLDAYLANGRDRSIRAWVAQIGAKQIDRPAPINVNRPSDLALVRG